MMGSLLLDNTRFSLLRSSPSPVRGALIGIAIIAGVASSSISISSSIGIIVGISIRRIVIGISISRIVIGIGIIVLIPKYYRLKKIRSGGRSGRRGSGFTWSGDTVDSLGSTLFEILSRILLILILVVLIVLVGCSELLFVFQSLLGFK